MNKRTKTIGTVIRVIMVIFGFFCLSWGILFLKTTKSQLQAIREEQSRIVEILQENASVNAQQLDQFEKELCSMEAMLASVNTKKTFTVPGLSKMENMLYAIKNENALITESIEAYASENTQKTSEMTQKMSDIQMLLENEGNNTIIDILTEKANYDYINKGLEYYDDKQYFPAYMAFSRALQYSPNNTTVIFYQIYCLYLGSHTIGLDSDTCQIIQNGIDAIRMNGFKNNEQLSFTATDMLQIVSAIDTNINGEQH